MRWVALLLTACGRIAFDPVAGPAPTDGAIALACTISLGTDHTCVADVAGAVRCVGRDDRGQTGDGDADPAPDPMPVLSIAGPATSLGLGGAFSCAVVSDQLSCWGADTNNILGGGGDSSSPVAIVGLPPIAEVDGGETFACLRFTDATVQCWGDGDQGETGDPTTPEIDTFNPIAVSGVDRIVPGADHACTLSGGELACWGSNSLGQLAQDPAIALGGCLDGSDDCSAAPLVMPVDNVRAASAGSEHTCAVLADGTARCWGDNEHGQLGSGDLIGHHLPQQVVGLTAARDIAAGQEHTCALLLDNTVRCWGERQSVGVSSTTDVQRPVAVDIPGDVFSIASHARARHTCAATTDGKVWCWGQNTSGQLGLGTFDVTQLPTESLLRCR